MLTKALLRQQMLAYLRARSPAEREQAGDDIAQRLWTLRGVACAGVLLLYASLPEEVPTDGIAREARRRGISAAYPRSSFGGILALHAVDDPAQLRVGRFGIREPDPAIHPRLPVRAVDAALIPGLAWDRTGRRLGRGGGFYDRLLAEPDWQGLRCGIFFAAQELPALPVDPWDIPLECVATEREVWCRPSMADPATP